jgi:hypothetical protein
MLDSSVTFCSDYTTGFTKKEADSFLAVQKNSRYCSNPKVNYVVYNSPPVLRTLKQANAVLKTCGYDLTRNQNSLVVEKNFLEFSVKPL